MASSLRTELLNVSFGPRMLLDKVSFSVDPGQCWGIVGPNGVGKSTLMKTLSGLVVPDSGKVVVTPIVVHAEIAAIEAAYNPAFVAEKLFGISAHWYP